MVSTGLLGEFPELRNDLVLVAARGGDTGGRVPVWSHRQAGRYLPEFRDLRRKHDFFQICRTPALACEVTLQPLARIDYDAAIIFSDILVVPQAMGLTVEMLPNVGPNFPHPLHTPEDMSRLNKSVDVSAELGYVFEAITLTRHELRGRVPLIGFSGAPFTLMAYCIEGRGSKTLCKAKRWLFQYPNESIDLLQQLTDIIVPYLVGQVKAGAQMLEVFDTWAGMLAPNEFTVFVLPFLAQIARRVKRDLRLLSIDPVPMIVFAKDAHYALEALSNTEFDVISLDWAQTAESALDAVGGRVALQGNLDPCVMYANQETIKERAQQMVLSFSGAKGYIANLGHGCYPDFSPDAMKAFVDAVHECRIPHERGQHQ